MLRYKRKIKLSQDQAMALSFILEDYRQSNAENNIHNATVRGLEDILDSQIWGSKYVSERKK